MHVFFFSYASENWEDDPHLRRFFKDLCVDVASGTPWKASDPELAFRDKHNLRVMDTYQPLLVEALQSSAVMVCITSPAYFGKPYCGKEYYIFDQRRRQGLPANATPPPVILPVIWAHDLSGAPQCIEKIQQEQEGFPDLYRSHGLRHVKIMRPSQYKKSVLMFAEAIVRAWQQHKDMPPLPIGRFEDIPNEFGQGDWHEAASSSGWLPGPDVANFVFAGGSSRQLPDPPGRYGNQSSDWRPYLPKSPKTIAEAARETVKKQGLRYREIPVDKNLAGELQGSKFRKNLTLVVANPRALDVPTYKSVTAFDALSWEGTSLLVPWDGTEGLWEAKQIKQAISATFPIVSQLSKPRFQAPITTFEELAVSLDITLAELRAALTKAAAEQMPRNDDPPATVTTDGNSPP